MNLEDINSSLENKSWFHQEGFISDDLCQQLSHTYFNQSSQGSFLEAKIGRGHERTQDSTIRKSELKWIEENDTSPPTVILNKILNDIMISTNEYFRLSLKRFESQLAVYNQGGFYKIHLDQHPSTKNRLMSCVIYLNNCPNGGELILYKKGTKTEIEKVIKPIKGSLVLFFSADIYHEVKLVSGHRQSISTWFRDDEILPLI